VRAFLAQAFGLEVAKATLVRAMERVAAKAEPLYGNIAFLIRHSQACTWDETGWRIGGHPAWLWDAVTRELVLYIIRRSRRHEVAMEVMRADYDGSLTADGFVGYDFYPHAFRQLCLAHQLRRCRELLETAKRGAVRFPRAVSAWIHDALALRDRRDARKIGDHGLLVAIGRLRARMDRLLEWKRSHEENETFAAHLRKHRSDLVTFLYFKEVEATNWRAEQALRGAVITRKISAGNRTDRGAHAQEVLCSVVRSAIKQKLDPIRLLVRVLRARDPIRVHRLAFNTS
jgi:transposase